MDPHSLTPPRTVRGPLAGLGIVVTRPARQAASFARKLAAVGADAIVFPTIVILPPSDRREIDAAHAHLQDYDVAIFVSANAVEYGVPAGVRWPASLTVLAPGPGTAEAIGDAGIPDVRIPRTTHDSEGLLALPEASDVRDKRVVVFRGEQGGRDLLVDVLRSRGAHVEVVGCYRRVAPASGSEGLVDALRERRAHAVTVTSSEGADNLWSVLSDDGRVLLATLPVFAPHPRIAARVAALGLRAVETAAGDAGLIAGLLRWHAGKV